MQISINRKDTEVFTIEWDWDHPNLKGLSREKVVDTNTIEVGTIVVDASLFDLVHDFQPPMRRVSNEMPLIAIGSEGTIIRFMYYSKLGFSGSLKKSLGLTVVEKPGWKTVTYWEEDENGILRHKALSIKITQGKRKDGSLYEMVHSSQGTFLKGGFHKSRRIETARMADGSTRVYYWASNGRKRRWK